MPDHDRRAGARPRLGTKAATLSLALGALLAGCAFEPAYPDQLATPEVIGVLESVTDGGSGGFQATLESGADLTIQEDDHVLLHRGGRPRALWHPA